MPRFSLVHWQGERLAAIRNMNGHTLPDREILVPEGDSGLADSVSPRSRSRLPPVCAPRSQKARQGDSRASTRQRP
jgi:hypothetical protein